jgi:CheY-like chemotaxis protein
MEALEFSSLRVLLLGPKSHGLQTLKSALSIAGVTRIAQVEDSRRALELLSLEHYDIVFFDKHADAVDGQPFAIAARRSPGVLNPMLPIFLLHDAARRRDVEEARDLGATDVMTCPLSPKTVMVKLRSALVAPRSFIAAPEFFGPDRRAKARPHFYGQDRRTKAARKARLVLPDAGGAKPTLV